MARKNDSKSRTQIVTPRKRRIANPRNPARESIKLEDITGALSAFVKPVAIVAVVVLLIVGYNALASSKAFQLRRVIVADISGSLRDDVEQTVRRVVNQQSIPEVDLGSV